MRQVYLLFFLSFLSFTSFSQKKDSSLPNILFIIADDMGKDAANGFSEGKIKPHTPHIDGIKKTGLSFNNFWVNPTCSPTRAAIITGKYGFRTNVVKVGNALSSSETILQKYISEQTNNAYTTALVGKWHLSGRKTTVNPEDFGIDYFAGIMKGGTRDYYSWNLYEDNTATTQTQYITEKFTDLSINWIKNQNKPWFLWLAYTAPHTPFHAPPKEMHSQGDLPQFSREQDAIPYYMAAIETMDYQIGRLLKNLPIKERENTVIIFIGDNGSPRRVAQAPYGKNTKGSLYQGGVNTPMYISGYGVTRRGEDNNLINNTDLFATISQIAGGSANQTHDSKSFKPLLTTSKIHRKFVYTEMIKNEENLQTIRNAQYKLISESSEPKEMYNLIIDPYETNNLLEVPLPSQLKKEKEKLEEYLRVIKN